MNYYNSKNISGTTVTAIRPKVEEALKEEGFGVLTEIDIQVIMKKKLGKDYLPHLILGTCNPVFADKVLSVDQQISLMLPCNVTIRQLENEEVEVAIINPLEMTDFIFSFSINASFMILSLPLRHLPKYNSIPTHGHSNEEFPKALPLHLSRISHSFWKAAIPSQIPVPLPHKKSKY